MTAGRVFKRTNWESISRRGKFVRIAEFLDLLTRKGLHPLISNEILELIGSRGRFSIAKFPGNGNNRVDISALSAGFTRKSREIDSIPSSISRSTFCLRIDPFPRRKRDWYLRHLDNRKVAGGKWDDCSTSNEPIRWWKMSDYACVA